MKVAGFALALFAAAFVLHWLCWRIHRPRRALRALLVLFHLTLAGGLLLAQLAPALRGVAPSGFWEVLHVCLFHVSASLAYTILYTALEMDSPTLTIVAYIAAAGARGRSRHDLGGLFGDDLITGSRFADLQAARLVAPSAAEPTRYVLTARGQRWAQVFHQLCRLFRLDQGG
jgi:hypothetical protein